MEQMSYQEAAKIRKSGLSDLIASKLMSDQSIGEALKTSIDMKLKAKAKGLKEKFDILNIARIMTGGSGLGPALIGKLLGREREDVEYFGGTKGKKGKKNKASPSSVKPIASKLKPVEEDKQDPLFTTIGPGRIMPVRRKDSAANILAKLYNLLKKSYEDKKLESELNEDFAEEKKIENEARHKELINALFTLKISKDMLGGLATEDDSGFNVPSIIPRPGGGGGGDKNKKENKDKKGKNRNTTTQQGKEGVEEKPKRKQLRDKKGRFRSATKVEKILSKGSKALKAAKGILKFFKRVPVVSTIFATLGVISDIEGAISDHEDGSITSEEMHKIITESIAGALGGVAGAEIGGILGTFVGGPVGSVLGAVGGFMGGEALGKYAADGIWDQFIKSPEPPTATAEDTSQTTSTAPVNLMSAPTGGTTSFAVQPNQTENITATPVAAPTATPAPSMGSPVGQRVVAATNSNNDYKLQARNTSPTVLTDNKTVNIGGKNSTTSMGIPASVRTDESTFTRSLRQETRTV